MKKYICIIASLVAVAGCTEQAITPNPDGREALVIGADFDTTVSSEAIMETKAESSNFGNDFFLYVTRGGTTTRNNANKKTDPNLFEVKDDSNNILYWDDIGGHDASATLDLIGIYPKTNSKVPAAANLASFTWAIDADQSTALTNSDLLISNRIKGYTLATQKTAVGNLAFRHVLSKMTVELIKGDGFTDADFKPADVKILNISTTAAVTVATDDEAAVGITNPGTSNVTLIPKKLDGSYTYEAIVFPGQDLSEVNTHFLEFTITINGKSNIYKVTLAQNAFDTFVQGKNHTFTVTVNKVNAKVTATVTNWDTTPTPVEATINIDYTDDATGSTSDVVEDGGRLYIEVDGQKRQYNYYKTETSWKAVGNPIYWDNINYGDDKLVANAVLINKSTDDYTPEEVYVGKSKTLSNTTPDKTLSFSVAHPFAKVQVVLKSEINADKSYKSDAVDLTEVKSFTLVGFKEFTNVDLGLTSETYQKVNYTTAANVVKTVTIEDDDLDKTTDTSYAVYTHSPFLYIQPCTIATSGTHYFTVHQENGAIKNDYKLKTTEADMKFEANKSYTITVTLKKTDVSYKVTVEPWGTGEDYEGEGTIED